MAQICLDLSRILRSATAEIRDRPTTGEQPSRVARNPYDINLTG